MFGMTCFCSGVAVPGGGGGGVCGKSGGEDYLRFILICSQIQHRFEVFVGQTLRKSGYYKKKTRLDDSTNDRTNNQTVRRQIAPGNKRIDERLDE